MTRLRLNLAGVLFLGITGLALSGFGQDAGILGPDSESYEAIFKLGGMPAVSMNFTDDFDKYKVIVITPNAVRDDGGRFMQNGTRFKQYVKAGGFLVALHQNDDGWHDKWLPYSCRMTDKSYAAQKIEETGHPLFDGVKDLKGISVPDSFSDVAGEWKVLSINHSADGKKRLISTIECTYGKGHVLLSGYDPFINLDKLDALDLKKARLMLNALKCALTRRGTTIEPDLKPFEKKLAARSVEIPELKLKSSKFFSPPVGLWYQAYTPGVLVAPTGRLRQSFYHGAAYEMTKHDKSKWRRQNYQLFRDAFVIHWSAQDSKRVAGIHALGDKHMGGLRLNVDMEIPSTLLDEHTSYTSLTTPEKDVRIETVVAISADGKFIIREVRVVNTGKSVMEKVEFHEFANYPYLYPVPGYKGPITYVEKDDILLASPRKTEQNVPVLEEVCGLAGVTKSAGHSIERGQLSGNYVLLSSRTEGRLKGLLTTGEVNNWNTGVAAAIMVWALGDLKPGMSNYAAAIFAVGDNRQDLDKELKDARALYAAREPLTAEADRIALLEKYAKLNWKEATHLRYEVFMDPKDPDGDGWDAAREKAAGTDPMKEDTDGDGLKDYEDPDPLKPEPLITKVTEEEIRNDKVLGLPTREILRVLRSGVDWTKARDLKELTIHLAKVRSLRANVVAQRIGWRSINAAGVLHGKDEETLGWKMRGYEDRDILAEYIAVCHRYDIDVQLEGLDGYWVGGEAALLEWLDKPGGNTCYMPGTACKNGWIKAVIAMQIYDVAKYPVEFMCIDEEQYNRGYANERFDTEVCMCPLCTVKFRAQLGYEMPGLRSEKPTDRQIFELTRWRVKCSTEAWRYWNDVARERNPNIKFFQQSIRMGGPYYRGGAQFEGGIGGADIGYGGQMGYGGDHLYYPGRYVPVKQFNHFIYAGVMKTAIATVPTRKGWTEHGKTAVFQEPIWCYGAMISPIAQGGKAIEYFNLPRLAKLSSWPDRDGPREGWKTTSADAFEYTKMAFVTIDEINDWIFAAEPPREMAVLWDTAADMVYTYLPESRKYALSHSGKTQSRYMTYLFRTGYPFDIFYLHYADYEALKGYPVIVLPSALCVAEDRIPMLERLVREGSSLVILGEYGQLDCDGRPYEKPLLLDLAGIEEISSPRLWIGALSTQGVLKDVDLGDLKFSVRKNVTPRPGTSPLAKMKGEDKGIYIRKLGRGEVIFMPGDFVAHCMSGAFGIGHNPRFYDITGPGTKLMNAILDHCLGENKSIIRYERIEPDEDADIELALLEKSAKDKTLFVLNWEVTKPSVIEVGLKMPEGRYKISQWSLKPSDQERIDELKVMPFDLNGKKVFTAEDLGNLRIELEPQQIKILHIE